MEPERFLKIGDNKHKFTEDALKELFQQLKETNDPILLNIFNVLDGLNYGRERDKSIFHGNVHSCHEVTFQTRCECDNLRAKTEELEERIRKLEG